MLIVSRRKSLTTFVEKGLQTNHSLRRLRLLESRPFYIYSDFGSSENHFIASGRMGDAGDIDVNTNWNRNPYSGNTCIKITYRTEGRRPNICGYSPPCKWSGVRWQNPANNWGAVANAGINLTGSKKLTFAARSDSKVYCKFMVGGIASGNYPDSLRLERSTNGLIELETDWHTFEIDLNGADLSYIIGGFGFVISWEDNDITKNNVRTINIYLDEIRFESD